MRRAAHIALTLLRVGIGLALLYYVLVVQGHWQAIADIVSTVWLLPVLAAFTLFGAGVEAIRLSLLCRSQGIRVGLGAAYRLVVVAAFFGVCIPGGTGGDVIKLYYLVSNNRGRGVEAATALLVDRAVGLFTMLLVAMLLALANLPTVVEVAAVRVLVLAALALMAAMLAGIFASWSSTVIRSRPFVFVMDLLPLNRYLWRVVEALHRFRDHRGAMVGAAAVSMVGHGALCGLFLLSVSMLLAAAPAGEAVFLSLLGMLANALPITPGGIGVGEAAFEGLFQLVGVDGGARLILAWRAAMLPLVILGALLYAVGGTSGRRMQAIVSRAEEGGGT